jgi:perosamine synthetase
MKKFNTALPFFPKEDINKILSEFKRILSGKGMLTMGRHVTDFEAAFARYTGSRYAVATNSCTAALEIALQCIGLGKTDEVIVPVQTFIATGSSVIVSGGKIRFVEIDDNFLLDFDDMKKKINSRTKAVILVHFGGLIHPKIFEIRDYLKKRNIYLIEDAAHASGARIHNFSAGTLGDFGCFSFFSTKIMTTGEGGMLTFDNKKFHALSSSLRNRGLDERYPKGERYVNIGSNRRLTEFQAILGLYQLKRLEDFVEHRLKIAAIYKDCLSPLIKKRFIHFQTYPDYIRHAYWRFMVFLDKPKAQREDLKKALSPFGIEINWPYEPLLHLQPIFRKKHGRFPKSEALAKRHFILPIHCGIRESDARFIARKVNECLV